MIHLLYFSQFHPLSPLNHPPPLKGDFSYLWSDFAEIWHEWPLHQWEMTEMVKLMITHIFRPPPPKIVFFLFMGGFSVDLALMVLISMEYD